MTMRIAVDALHALYPAGGVARYARSLITAMASQGDHGEIILFYNRFRGNGALWRPPGASLTVRNAPLPRRLLQGLWQTINWPPIEMFCGRVDVFHGLHFVLPASRKTKRVLTVHDLTYLRHPDYYRDARLNDRGYRQELPRALDRADAVITVSWKTRDDLVDLLNFPAERIRVIHHGVAERFFASASSQNQELIRRHYRITPPYAVFLVGTPEPRKNIARTVAAVRRAAPSIDLVLVGERHCLQPLIGSPTEHLVFTGTVPEDHLPALLAGATISVYPSLEEGFGLPLLESMACGVPVLTSTRGALPEIAGGAAMLVNPEDIESMVHGVSLLLNDEALRQQMAQAGRRRAADFTWERAAAQTAALYRELL
jgi:glycosyltransferase involved in cell wall biosynthesis